MLKYLQKRLSQAAICKKTKMQLQIYSKAYKSRGQLYERMQRVTDLFENTNIMYENVKSRCLLYENVQILKNLYEKGNQDAI